MGIKNEDIESLIHYKKDTHDTSLLTQISKLQLNPTELMYANNFIRALD